MESRTERMTHLATRVGCGGSHGDDAPGPRGRQSGVAAGASQDGDRSPRGKAGPDGGKGEADKKEAPPQAKVKLGLSINEPGAFRGYTLLNPMNKKTTYLIDMEGRVVKAWESEHNSMHAALSPGERPSLPHRGARGRGAGLRRRAGLGRADPGVRLGRQARLGLPVPQRQAIPPPRRREDAQRQRAHGRLGQEDRRRGDRRRAEEGAGERLRAAGLDRGGQADGQDDGRGRLGMAPLGPPRAGPRRDQGELRRRGLASRAGRHQLRREPDGRPRRPARPARARRQARPAPPGTRRRTR